MAGNAKSSPGSIISLPNGGGALQGLGEKFSPDLHTGTGNFSVPLALPPGRNGLHPTLSLAYSTGHGNGPFGLGWKLSVPTISRRTSKGVPLYHAGDVYVLSAADDLVPVGAGSNGATRFRPRTEGLFALIDHHSSPIDYWEVKSKDGLINRYGNASSPNATPAIVADPDDRSRIFAWYLSETRDPFGNRIVYEYERDLQTSGARRWDQTYLRRVQYVDYTDAAGELRYLACATFEYDDDRRDAFSEYRAGFEIRTTRRCRRILVTTEAGRSQLVRTYHLHYDDAARVANGVSLLQRMEVEGHGDVDPLAAADAHPASEWLPSLDFRYSAFDVRNRDFVALTGPLPAVPIGPDVEVVDVFGNGLPDIIEMNGSVRVWRNRGHGAFDLPQPMRDAPSGLALSDAGVQLLDLNGDSRADLLITDGVTAGSHTLRFGAAWGPFRPFRRAPTFNLEDPEVRFIDLDGDGVTDALRSGARLECYFHDAIRGWTERREPRGSVDVAFSDPRVKTADMSGDSLQDIVLIHDGNVEYWPNLGHGRFGARIHMRNSPRFPHGYAYDRILLGDVDGDGLADIVYVEGTEVRVWLNQSGNAWSEQPYVVEGTPPISNAGSLRLVDIMGTGVNGVLWSMETSALSRRNYWFLDLAGSEKPYLLSALDNHMGALTRVHYAPSTRFFLEDEKVPATRWRTPLPFPVHVVARAEVEDEISGTQLTTEYRYHGGYWDGLEREFRGFGMVEQVDTQFFSGRPTATSRHFSPPTLTKTWFHQGAIGDESGDWGELDPSAQYWSGDAGLLGHTEQVNSYLAGGFTRRERRDALRTLRGSLLRTELYGLDGSAREARPYTVSEFAYGVREESPPVAPNESHPRIFFPFATAQRTTQWERGADPLTQFTFSDAYDQFGQSTRQTTAACPRGWRDIDDRPAAEYLATRTQTAYADQAPPGVYIVNRVATATTREVTSSAGLTVLEIAAIADHDPRLRVFSSAFSFYDGAPFEGLPAGTLGLYGALVRVERLVLTDRVLTDAYGSTRPPPFVTQGQPVWTAEYPAEFQALIPSLPGPAGYVYRSGPGDLAGYYALTERHQYDFHDNLAAARGLPTAHLDPGGKRTNVTYDTYALLPVQVSDVADASTQPPRTIATTASFNYRVLQPSLVTDANGNEVAFRFSPLGLLEETWARGNPSRAEGDRQSPSLRLFYDFLAFDRSPAGARQPVFVRTVQRTRHDTDTAPSETIEAREYSDGFGRVIQKRAQGEEVRFGDPILGDGVLPANQADGRGGSVSGVEQANPAVPHVVVSGWQIYDNKGRVIESYEPFFDLGWDYRSSNAVQGGSTVTFYDPRGHAIRRVNPDGCENRTVLGAPGSIAMPDLSDPDQFEPTPWESYTYDENDNGGRTHAAQSVGYRHHWNTPSSTVVDALGRVVATTDRNRARPGAPDNPLAPIEEHRTGSIRDIRGNLLRVVDPLGRVTFQYVYDLADHPLRVWAIDGGARTAVLDAAGNSLEARDDRGALVLRAFDALNRPIRLWARNAALEPVTLRERLIYGDEIASGLSELQARERNLRAKLYRHYDEAGLLTVDLYDFKSNVRQKTRAVVADSALAPGSALRMDWDVPPPLEGSYVTTTSYDALNRTTAAEYPQDVEGQRRAVAFEFNGAGSLSRVTVDGELYVERIAYDAKGLRTLIVYGNGVMSRCAYDARTFHLVRERIERCEQDAAIPSLYRLTGGVLRDMAHAYDLAGNVLRLTDRTPGSGVLNHPQASLLSGGDPVLEQALVAGDALVREFRYDPLYRLDYATGRSAAVIPSPRPWSDDARAGFDSASHGTPDQDNAPRLTDIYTETYRYDPAGNLLNLRHERGTVGLAWTRRFGMGGFAPDDWEHLWQARFNQPAPWPGAPGNRMTHVSETTAPAVQTHTFDAAANLVRENVNRRFEWDHSGRLVRFIDTPGTTPTVDAHYLYDATGARVKKIVHKQGGRVESTTYIGASFEHHRLVRAAGAAIHENNRLHVLDSRGRIAMRRVGAAFPLDGAATIAVQYHLADSIGSSAIVVGGATAAGATFVNREEYFPYGETSFGSYGRKRYRFTGKERDEESGLHYHSARYYASWLARWVSCDPIGLRGGPNLFAYAGGSPVRFRDVSGLQRSETAVNAPESMDADAWRQAANEAAEFTAGEVTEHRQRAKASGVGKYDGSEGDFADWSPRAQQSFVKKRGGGAAPLPEPTNCIDFAADIALRRLLHEYLLLSKPGVHRASERMEDVATFLEVYADSRGRSKATGAKAVVGGRGTAVGRHLVDQYGFKTIYVSNKTADPDAARVAKAQFVPHTLTGKKAFVNGADTGIPVDVTLPVHQMMLRKEVVKTIKGSPIPVDRINLKQLNAIPFAFIVADNGFHTAILSHGKVFDAHWTDGPSSKDVLTSKRLETFMNSWSNFVLVIPP